MATEMVTDSARAELLRRIRAAKGGVANAEAAVYQLALTSLRNIIGKHDLDEVLQERDLFFRERPHLASIARDIAEQRAVFAQRQ